MKTLKSIALGLLLITTFCAAQAAGISAEKLSKRYAINTYVNAMAHGKLDGLNEVLDPSVKFSMLRGTQVLSFGKDDMIAFMKGFKNVEQKCNVSTTEIENTDNITVVRIDMKYEDFVRSNYVTIANTGDGWKITDVYSTFK